MTEGRRAPAVGGPVGGQEIFFSFPRGILLLDQHTGLVWIYDYMPVQGRLIARSSEGTPYDEAKGDKALMDGSYELITIHSQPLGLRPSAPSQELRA